ncbi:hypothetical protein AALO_G00303120 [Alosa alosa]|uniref:C-type lectin domain-containing protein n=1 Tax=Alosa alosa TaxID=278164 RepID=A0AAV6FFC7_9TELE|nr:hypothetical protein AALO_G00303120 [Alosa alosa]
MTLLLFTILLVSGLCSLSSSVPRRFHVVKEQKSWTEAQQYCREEFTDLATIDNMTEMEKVNSMILEAGAGNAWIGLKQGKWRWSLADREFYRENESEFRNWASNPPNGGAEKECVARKHANGKWHHNKCIERLPFICYDGGNSTQPYVLVTEEKNWPDAQRYCREKHTDLASVRNLTENDMMIKEVRAGSHEGGNGEAWIGLFRDGWEWSDGSNSSFRYWGTGEPNFGTQFLAVTTQHIYNKLVLVRENKTWREALQYCREHHVDLVSVTSKRVQRWVRARAKGASTAHVWVGLLHSYGVGWYWVCGQTVCYRNWTQGHDQVDSFQQRVGAVESGGGLWVSNLTKTDKLHFICTTEEWCD